MVTYLRLLVVILVIVSGAACSEGVSTPISSSASGGSRNVVMDELAGTWILVSMQATGQPPQATPAGASYTLTLRDNRLSTRADCNVCSGPFSLSGETLTAGPTLACTRAACRTSDFEYAYTRVLGGDGTATVSGSTLRLSSDRGVLHFTR